MKQYLRPVAQTSFGVPDSFRPFHPEPAKPKVKDPTLPFGVEFDAARYEGHSERFNRIIAPRHMDYRYRYLTPAFPAGFIARHSPDMIPIDGRITENTPIALSFRSREGSGWHKRYVFPLVGADGGFSDLQKIDTGVVDRDTPRIQLINQMSDWAHAVTQMPGYLPAMRRDFSMIIKANLVDEHVLGMDDNDIGRNFSNRQIRELGLWIDQQSPSQ